MATLEHLVAAGKLKKHDPDLENDELPVRYVYMTMEVSTWIATTLRSAKREQGRSITPFEQVEQRLYEFAIGRRMTYGSMYHPLDPIGHYVWELKTAHVRLIGWFPRKATFLVVCGCMKSDLLKRADYTPHILRAVQFRTTLDLDHPKSVTGVSHNDVL